MWPGTSCRVVTLLGLNLGLTEMQSQNPHLEVYPVSAVWTKIWLHSWYCRQQHSLITRPSDMVHGEKTGRRSQCCWGFLAQQFCSLTGLCTDQGNTMENTIVYGVVTFCSLKDENPKDTTDASTDAPAMQPQGIKNKYKGLSWTRPRVKNTQWNGWNNTG